MFASTSTFFFFQNSNSNWAVTQMTANFFKPFTSHFWSLLPVLLRGMKIFANIWVTVFVHSVKFKRQQMGDNRTLHNSRESDCIVSSVLLSLSASCLMVHIKSNSVDTLLAEYRSNPMPPLHKTEIRHSSLRGVIIINVIIIWVIYIL